MGLMGSARSVLVNGALRVVARRDPHAELYRSRVLTGPIRGMVFATSRRERLAFALGTYERHVVSEIEAHLGEGMVAYDVGANAGYMSLVMARAVGSSGHVLAFEPDPQNLRALRFNLEQNKLYNVAVREQAVSDAPGKLTFASYSYSLVGHIAREDDPGDARHFDVEATTLDRVWAETGAAPDFVKIDVEGAEREVLNGATELLAHARPTILAEIRAEHWPAVFELLESHHYDFRFLAGGWDMREDGLADVLMIPEERRRVSEIVERLRRGPG
jgi:FkbM family methyltransferase